MDLYVCCNCGAIINADDFKEQAEYMGEYLGRPAYESRSYTPCCHSDYESYIEKCKECIYFTGVNDTRTGEPTFGCELHGEEVSENDSCEQFEIDDDLIYRSVQW